MDRGREGRGVVEDGREVGKDGGKEGGKMNIVI